MQPSMFLAKVYHPLYFNTAAYVSKPISWRGGHTLPLRKIPQPSKCVQCRDVNLEGLASKRYGTQLRRLLKTMSRDVCVSSQFGSGLNDASVGLAHLHLRTQIESAEVRGMSPAVFLRCNRFCVHVAMFDCR